jgi:hypothetical protein
VGKCGVVGRVVCEGNAWWVRGILCSEFCGGGMGCVCVIVWWVRDKMYREVRSCGTCWVCGNVWWVRDIICTEV